MDNSLFSAQHFYLFEHSILHSNWQDYVLVSCTLCFLGPGHFVRYVWKTGGSGRECYKGCLHKLTQRHIVNGILQHRVSLTSWKQIHTIERMATYLPFDHISDTIVWNTLCFLGPGHFVRSGQIESPCLIIRSPSFSLKASCRTISVSPSQITTFAYSLTLSMSESPLHYHYGEFVFYIANCLSHSGEKNQSYLVLQLFVLYLICSIDTSTWLLQSTSPNLWELEVHSERVHLRDWYLVN